ASGRVTAPIPVQRRLKTDCQVGDLLHPTNFPARPDGAALCKRHTRAVISAETLSFHYRRHHKDHVVKLNQLGAPRAKQSTRRSSTTRRKHGIIGFTGAPSRRKPAPAFRPLWPHASSSDQLGVCRAKF